MSLMSIPRLGSWVWAAWMSVTVSPVSAEPGVAVMSPCPKVMEVLEPEGVTWMMRRPGWG